MSVVNSIMGQFLRSRMRRIEWFMGNPHKAQRYWFEKLTRNARNTEWGKEHNYSSIKTQQDFVDRVAVQDYDSMKPYIDRMMLGEKNILWQGKIKWFAKSSGTTSDKSKFIPVSWEHHQKCLIQGSKDTLSLYYHNNPNANIFQGKGIVMGGASESFDKYPKTKYGDVSAIMLDHMPAIAKYFYTPDMKTALMNDWEHKIKRIAEITSQENVTNLGGVPTWTIVLFRKILELTGKENILEVWPNLEVYIHGGVSFTPYQEQFQQFLPGNQVNLLEIYNASEGYFSIQSDLKQDDMLLLLDNGIYYEFVPSNEWGKDYPKAIPLHEVEIGQNYAIVISTNSGLWRYMPGDTVKFTSTSPYKIKVTGRTKHFINAFGEEVMIENTDKALSMTCREMLASVQEYTVAPIYIKGHQKGGHEWLIEFDTPPKDLKLFSQLLDKNLQKVNSDYEAKRYKDMALDCLTIRHLPSGTFHNWLKGKGKYGGQNKVPRLANHRMYIDEILEMMD
jgi:hypothetical protein